MSKKSSITTVDRLQKSALLLSCYLEINAYLDSTKCHAYGLVNSTYA